ncbi:MAG: LLM class flavin-dependent oxidoreductase [Proteobacteria bacterium]|nr:LLM class flavin-dependent oxidoreductase [Pseudomonadota bacterium]
MISRTLEPQFRKFKIVFTHPWPWPDVYREELDLTCHVQDLRLDNVWMSEHHFGDDGYMSCPLTIAAAVAARTKAIRIGTCIILMRMHGPVRLAEQAATVDLLSNGRFDQRPPRRAYPQRAHRRFRPPARLPRRCGAVARACARPSR